MTNRSHPFQEIINRQIMPGGSSRHVPIHPFEFNPGVISQTNKSVHMPASKAELERHQEKEMSCANIPLACPPMFPGRLNSFREGTTSQGAMKAQECLSSFPIHGDRCFFIPSKANGTSCSNLRAPSPTPRSTEDDPELRLLFGLQRVADGPFNSHNELSSFFYMS